MYLLSDGERFSGKAFFFSGKASNPHWERSSCIESNVTSTVFIVLYSRSHSESVFLVSQGDILIVTALDKELSQFVVADIID